MMSYIDQEEQQQVAAYTLRRVAMKGKGKQQYKGANPQDTTSKGGQMQGKGKAPHYNAGGAASGSDGGWLGGAWGSENSCGGAPMTPMPGMTATPMAGPPPEWNYGGCKGGEQQKQIFRDGTCHPTQFKQGFKGKGANLC